MFILNGQKLTVGKPFVVDDVQYPGNWLLSASGAELRERGIQVVPDPAIPDRRLFEYAENADGSLAITPRAKRVICDLIWEEIKSERDRRTQDGGYLVDGHWFHSDTYSLSQQQGLAFAAMQVQAVGGDLDTTLIDTPWQTMGGGQVAMTARLALQLPAAATAKQVEVFAAASTHKAALEASDTPESYDYSGGWPRVFGED